MDDPDAFDAEWRFGRFSGRFSELMERCHRAYKAGSTLAISEAEDLCTLFGQPPSEWLRAAVAELVAQHRTPNEARRNFDDQVHYERWFAVMEFHRLRGHTWEASYEAAAEASAKTAFAGSAETMKASYTKVQRDIREGRDSKYWQPTDPRFRLPD